MIEEENDVFLFTGSNNDTFQLISNAVLDQTWIFNIGNGTSATVAEINEINVLGQLDSVKTILLDSGEEILLSKNFGLFKFPDLLLAANGVIYELVANLLSEAGTYDQYFTDQFSRGRTYRI